MMEKPIRTTFIHPPIPVRSSDWQAVRRGDEDDGLYGRGATEQGAIDDLLAQLDDMG